MGYQLASYQCYKVENTLVKFRIYIWEIALRLNTDLYLISKAYEKLSDLKRKRAKANKKNQQQESEPSKEKVELWRSLEYYCVCYQKLW